MNDEQYEIKKQQRLLEEREDNLILELNYFNKLEDHITNINRYNDVVIGSKYSNLLLESDDIIEKNYIEILDIIEERVKDLNKEKQQLIINKELLAKKYQKFREDN